MITVNFLLISLFKRESSKAPKLVTFINHFSYLQARKNLELFQQFDEIHCDGIVLCLFLRLVGVQKTRTSFDMTSLAPTVFKNSELRRHKIYLLGGEEGIADNAAETFLTGFPDLNLVGVRNGYFSSSEDRMKTLEQLLRTDPDVVIASMGTPYQEQFLADLKNLGWNKQGYTSGGFFHQTAKYGLRYYPEWVNKLNLRWAFRIIDEPKLIRRYTFDFVKFVILFTYDAILFKLQNKRA